MQKFYPHAYHGVDKLGRPIYIEQIGLLNTTGFLSVSTPARLQTHFIKYHEDQMNFRFPLVSMRAGKRVETLLLINDCAGATMATCD